VIVIFVVCYVILVGDCLLDWFYEEVGLLW